MATSWLVAEAIGNRDTGSQNSTCRISVLEARGRRGLE